VKGLDFKAAGADIPAIDSEDEEEFSAGEEQSEEGKEVERSEPSPVVTAPPEKKESKAERESKRKVEREAEKERERAARADERVKKEENMATKLKTPSSKSPWVRCCPLFHSTNIRLITCRNRSSNRRLNGTTMHFLPLFLLPLAPLLLSSPRFYLAGKTSSLETTLSTHRHSTRKPRKDQPLLLRLDFPKPIKFSFNKFSLLVLPPTRYRHYSSWFALHLSTP